VSIPVKFGFDHRLFIKASRVMVTILAAWMFLVVILTIIDGQSRSILNLKYLTEKFVGYSLIPLTLILPLCFAPFIHAKNNSKRAKLSQAIIIIGLATPIFLYSMQKALEFLSNDLEAAQIKLVSVILLGVFYFLNAVLHLPRILESGKQS